MTDYWQSKANYWCKFCEQYIRDDIPSRQHHENGTKHKERQRAFVNKQYKQAEIKERERVNEARTIAAINQAAGAPSAPAISTSQSKSTVSRDPYANYSTPASLGYTDQEERFSSIGQEGVIGEWKAVAAPISQDRSTDSSPPPATTKLSLPSISTWFDNHDMNLSSMSMFKERGHPNDIYDPGHIRTRDPPRMAGQHPGSLPPPHNNLVWTAPVTHIVNPAHRGPPPLDDHKDYDREYNHPPPEYPQHTQHHVSLEEPIDYTHSWTVSTGEGEAKIKRPRNAWIIYRSEKLKELKPQAPQAELSKTLGEMWRNESLDVRKEYEIKAEIEKVEHSKAFPNYRFQPKPKRARRGKKMADMPMMDMTSTPVSGSTSTRDDSNEYDLEDQDGSISDSAYHSTSLHEDSTSPPNSHRQPLPDPRDTQALAGPSSLTYSSSQHPFNHHDVKPSMPGESGMFKKRKTNRSTRAK